MSERVVSAKQLWLLVGSNGAGKSTFHRLFLAPLLAEQQRESLLLRGFSFCFETVYSHPSKVDFVARSKALGYEVILVLIHLNNASPKPGTDRPENLRGWSSRSS